MHDSNSNQVIDVNIIYVTKQATDLTSVMCS